MPCDGGVVFIVLPPPATKLHETATYFRLNHSSNTLELNQTWYCGDLGDRDQYRFTTFAAAVPALDPEAHYVNNMTVPQVRVDGSAPKRLVSAAAAAVSEQKLAPSTLQRPGAFGRSCTVSMLTAPPPASLEIGDFWFDTYWKDISTRVSYVYMFVTNGLLNATLNANAEGAAMTPNVPGVSNLDVWYGCNGGAVAAPAGSLLLNCSFAFHRGTNRLAMRESWICADSGSCPRMLHDTVVDKVCTYVKGFISST